MANMNTYYVGQPVRLRVAVTVDGVAATPSSPAFNVEKPDGTVESLGAGSEDPTGTFTAICDAPDIEGDYWWSFSGGGGAKGYTERIFTVLEKRVEP